MRVWENIINCVSPLTVPPLEKAKRRRTAWDRATAGIDGVCTGVCYKFAWGAAKLH